MVYDFMHQRMILFVLYGLFHKFHANVAFPAIYAHFLPNRKYRKYRVSIVSKPKISCEPKKKISLRGGQGHLPSLQPGIKAALTVNFKLENNL